LQKCKGDFSELNFQRQVTLEKRTIEKRKKEWEREQKVLGLEIKYNDEFKFCSEVVSRIYDDKTFEFLVGERDGEKYFYAGKYTGKSLSKIYQISSWLDWMKQGTVNEIYLERLHETMKMTPEQVVQEAKEKFKTFIEEEKEKEEKLKDARGNKVLSIKKPDGKIEEAWNMTYQRTRWD